MEVDEACPLDGGGFGSTAIDRSLFKLLQLRFGEPFENLPPERVGVGSEFMRNLENAKINFVAGSEYDESYQLYIPGLNESTTPDVHYDFSDNSVIISRQDESRERFSD